MKANYRIPKAQLGHPALLPAVERAAADIYPEEVLPGPLRDLATSVEDFERAQQLGLLWVAVSAAGSPVGFALIEDHGGNLHLDELDVHSETEHGFDPKIRVAMIKILES